MTELERRPISSIAREIKTDWSARGKGVNFAAVPYLHAMFTLDSISDDYGHDSGETIVLHFLSNASDWRGEVAKRVKAELKSLLKSA